MDIEELRKKAGKTQKEVACRMKVSLTTFRNWERKRTEPAFGEKVLLRAILEEEDEGKIGSDVSMNIKKLRKKAGKSMEELAYKMKVTLNTIRNWEQGLTSPSYGEKVLLEIILKEKKNERDDYEEEVKKALKFK